MHHDEMWQVYRPNGEPVVGEGWDSALGNPEETGSDKIVGVSVIFVYRLNDAGELELLWQKRSEKVDRFPGDYDISAGGHINLGESVVEGAVRECHEEIGAEINTDDLRFVTMRPFNRNRFAWVFMTDWTGKEDDFHFNDEEVSEVKWVPFAEAIDFCSKYAKAPLKKEKLTFELLREWFLQNGNL
ncbi:NUDIX domain-containing protein [Candidatus Saccharibacteria bacterium]|nr:NUDIX domain-containing protein [Candidatus Saccharibacteria bacterium]